MPTGNLHINQPLTNLSIEYKNENYVADQIVPALPVVKNSDVYLVYNTDFRLPQTRRAYGAEANQVTWGVSTASYKLEWHSLKDVVSDKDRENADSPLSLDADTTAFLTDKIMLRKEEAMAKLLFTTTNWSVSRTVTATTESWHTSGAYPVQAILSIGGLVLAGSGKSPNIAAMGKEAYNITRENANVLSRIQYVERAIVTTDILAALFDLNNVYVVNAVLDTTQEGLTTGAGTTTAFLVTDDIFLGYMNPTPGRKMASAAYKLYKPSSRTTKKWRDDNREGDWIEVSDEFQFRAVASACGAVIKAINLP